ncbi:MAG: FKBP-type peptidyl-prolyl cis-trans isomerase [Chitinophagaceae bacterium]
MKRDKDAVGCAYDPCALKAADSETNMVENYLATNNLTAVKHCSGLYYKIINEGSGIAPTSCSSVYITYKGSYTNGNVFDKATTPVSFSLATLIDGWKNGLPLVKKGGKIMLYVPPTLGYGPADYRGIPGNSVLIFDIDLIDVQ